ncbi:MAG TPA: hypothetical protein VII52_16775 [Gemmatimonadaceae bacterium]
MPLITGGLLFALGSYVALRPLWRPNGLVTGARWLDMAFAVVFMLRGVINLRTAIARRRSVSSHA